MTTIEQAVTKLKEKHGGLRSAARAIGVDFVYLWRLGNGSKINPSPKVLRRLKLRKVVTYEDLA